MIERLLAAEGALARDELDNAQRLYGQVADADPRNAIALVGLARVAARRGDADGAREHAQHALAIDPEEAAAHRLLVELSRPAESPVESAGESPAEIAVEIPPPPREAPPPPLSARRPSLIERVIGWLGLRRG